MKQRFLLFLFLLFLTGLFSSCETVKPYQRVYLNDRDMKMGSLGARQYEDNVHAYREGATGGGSKKTSGGCGCN
jgi:hypothetical protein